MFAIGRVRYLFAEGHVRYLKLSWLMEGAWLAIKYKIWAIFFFFCK
jgi:hypothetical protein